MAGEECTPPPVSNSQIGVPILALEVWLIPLGVGLESGGVELESGGVVSQPIVKAKADKAVNVCFMPATIQPPPAGASVWV
jgi:hypothetical protein